MDDIDETRDPDGFLLAIKVPGVVYMVHPYDR